MTAYYFLIISIFIFGAAFYRTNRKKFIVLSFLALFFIMGFRNAAMVGDDSATSYYQAFLDMRFPNGYVFKLRNLGLSLFMKIVFELTGNYQIFIILVAAFICYSYSKLISKYSVNPFISIMWFLGMLFYTFLFSALKQAMAMAILCYAYDALIQKNKKNFIILVCVASCFHFPAMVFLPAWWIAKMNLGRNFFILFALLIIIVFVFRSQIASIMNLFYYTDSYSLVDLKETKFAGTKAILMGMSLVIAFILRTPNIQEDRQYTILLMFTGIAIVFQLFCFYSNNFERLADYYYQFSILFMPMLFERRERTKAFVSKSTIRMANSIGPLIITGFSVWRFLSYLSTGGGKLSPYYFCWQGIKVIVIRG